MKIIKVWSVLAAAAITGVFAGCGSEVTGPSDAASVDPEAMCVEWSNKSCTMLSGCCKAPAAYDEFLCQTLFSAYCLDNLNLELARSDEYVFDKAFAQECLTPINECDPPEPKLAHPIACANMLTGYRQVGTGCFQTADCKRPANGRAYCYWGQNGDLGVCTNIVDSTNGKCGFSKETLVYSICPENTYCDVNGVVMPTTEIPSDWIYEFEAPCKPYRANGESCLDASGGNFDLIPCQKDLYCNVDKSDPAASKCLPLKKIGDPCSGESPGECGQDAYCAGDTSKCTQDQPHETPFCYAPAVCGDGECSLGETYDSCIDDCGYCGDGVCSGDEQQYCYDDCPVCGDGFCSGDEPNTCPPDCTPNTCMTCGDYISNQQMGTLCDGSGSIFLLFSQCMCGGACANACSTSFCNGADPSTECVQCAQDAMVGCGNEFTACMNDM